MTAGELRNLLALHGHRARISGDEVKVQVCWSCGNDRWNWEMNPRKGVAHCWACGVGGRLDHWLSQALGEAFEIPVKLDGPSGPARFAALPSAPDFKFAPAADVESARLYLERRGFPPQAARLYGLCVCLEEGHQLYGRLCVPASCFWTSTVLGWVGRAYAPAGKRPKYLSTLPGRVLCGWRVRGREPTLVVEGFFDGMNVHRAGFNAAVLGGVEAENEEAILAARLPPDVPLLVFLDGSAEAEARRLLWRLRAVRPDAGMITLPPGMDPGATHPTVIRKLVSRALE